LFTNKHKQQDEEARERKSIVEGTLKRSCFVLFRLSLPIPNLLHDFQRCPKDVPLANGGRAYWLKWTLPLKPDFLFIVQSLLSTMMLLGDYEG